MLCKEFLCRTAHDELNVKHRTVGPNQPELPSQAIKYGGSSSRLLVLHSVN